MLRTSARRRRKGSTVLLAFLRAAGAASDAHEVRSVSGSSTLSGDVSLRDSLISWNAEAACEQ